MPNACVVFSTLPDVEAARKLAKSLVEERLAACVNVLAPCTSIYRWQGDVREDGEVPVIIKTTAERYPALEAHIRKHHPYELPEIVALNAAAGLPDYLRWIVDSTLDSNPPSQP
ncbi:MAG: divalent-cation tolerance protein CutA [Betaproteobacteria bacterium]|nr:divalent-cation tolerance protein CutA [Betaproteobacteria bacterium]